MRFAICTNIYPPTKHPNTQNHHWLVVWDIFYDFPYIGNSNPNWLITSRGVSSNHQSDQLIYQALGPTIWTHLDHCFSSKLPPSCMDSWWHPPTWLGQETATNAGRKRPGPLGPRRWNDVYPRHRTCFYMFLLLCGFKDVLCSTIFRMIPWSVTLCHGAWNHQIVMLMRSRMSSKLWWKRGILSSDVVEWCSMHEFEDEELAN